MSTAPVLLSITQIAAEFGCSRDTARQVLAETGVAPAGKGQRGHSLYRLRDVRNAIDGDREPTNMSPSEARAHWGARAKQIEVESLERRRIPLEEIERLVGSLMATQSTSALVSEVERDAYITDHRLLTALENALAPWAIRQYEAYAAVCQRYGFSVDLAARVLPDGYYRPTGAR